VQIFPGHKQPKISPRLTAPSGSQLEEDTEHRVKKVKAESAHRIDMDKLEPAK
jgi:hypothetical protein